jgi:hypothetical protein
LTKTREDYVSDYLDSVKNLGVVLEPPVQQITKTAEAAWTVDSYNIEPSDEPAEKSPPRRTR